GAGVGAVAGGDAGQRDGGGDGAEEWHGGVYRGRAADGAGGGGRGADGGEWGGDPALSGRLGDQGAGEQRAGDSGDQRGRRAGTGAVGRGTDLGSDRAEQGRALRGGADGGRGRARDGVR